MARSVADAAALLTVLAGFDPDDPATEPLKSQTPLDYTQFLNRDGLKGLRVGVMRQASGLSRLRGASPSSALAPMRSSKRISTLGVTNIAPQHAAAPGGAAYRSALTPQPPT